MDNMEILSQNLETYGYNTVNNVDMTFDFGIVKIVASIGLN